LAPQFDVEVDLLSIEEPDLARLLEQRGR
jgi:hypothetical protein